MAVVSVIVINLLPEDNRWELQRGEEEKEAEEEEEEEWV
jgi:hypothetical protein